MKIHRELERYLNEDCYTKALDADFGNRAKTEALVRVRHSDFIKDYFIEFVNNHRTLAERQTFQIEGNTLIPKSLSPVFDNFTGILISLLKDIGTGLESSLYTEAIVHFFGGTKTILQPTPVTYQGTIIGTQNLPILAEATTFKITALPEEKIPQFQNHARRLLKTTPLTHILHANITLKILTLSIIKK
jgi:hypothetical protein